VLAAIFRRGRHKVDAVAGEVRDELRGQARTPGAIPVPPDADRPGAV
jgi:hypothetical protein